MKRVSKLLLMSAPTFIIMPVVTISCAPLNSLKYKAFNVIKTTLINLIGDVNKYFEENNDPDIKQLLNELEQTLDEMKKTEINESNPPEKYISTLNAKINDFINRFIKIKEDKINLIVTYFEKLSDGYQYIKDELSEPKYIKIAKELHKNLKEQTAPTIEMPKTEINEKIVKIEKIINDAKSEKEKLDNKEIQI